MNLFVGTSLSDAKMLKNVSQDLIGSDAATRYLGQEVQALAQIFGQEVATEVDRDAFQNTLDAR